MIGQVAPKHKGKISRVLAAKTALSVRVDALGDTSEATIAVNSRVKVESRMRQLEGGAAASVSKSTGPAKYDAAAAKALAPSNYNPASDMIMDVEESEKSSKKDKKKRKHEEVEPEEEEEEEVEKKSSKKEKKSKKSKVEEPEEEEVVVEAEEKKKKKKKDKKE